jgi:uncharacterized RmlC-like cupin family protein
LSANAESYQLSILKRSPELFSSANGRRAFFEFCDLGVADATQGEFGVKICRSKGEAASTGWHYHPCAIQVIYVLQGWVTLAFADGQVVKAEAGTCINIPPGMVHNEVEFSDDMEIMEFASPAAMTNVAVEDPFAATVANG